MNSSKTNELLQQRLKQRKKSRKEDTHHEDESSQEKTEPLKSKEKDTSEAEEKKAKAEKEAAKKDESKPKKKKSSKSKGSALSEKESGSKGSGSVRLKKKKKKSSSSKTSADGGSTHSQLDSPLNGTDKKKTKGTKTEQEEKSPSSPTTEVKKAHEVEIAPTKETTRQESSTEALKQQEESASSSSSSSIEEQAVASEKKPTAEELERAKEELQRASSSSSLLAPIPDKEPNSGIHHLSDIEERRYKLHLQRTKALPAVPPSGSGLQPKQRPRSIELDSPRASRRATTSFTDLPTTSSTQAQDSEEATTNKQHQSQTVKLTKHSDKEEGDADASSKTTTSQEEKKSPAVSPETSRLKKVKKERRRTFSNLEFQKMGISKLRGGDSGVSTVVGSSNKQRSLSSGKRRTVMFNNTENETGCDSPRGRVVKDLSPLEEREFLINRQLQKQLPDSPAGPSTSSSSLATYTNGAPKPPSRARAAAARKSVYVTREAVQKDRMRNIILELAEAGFTDKDIWEGNPDLFPILLQYKEMLRNEAEEQGQELRVVHFSLPDTPDFGGVKFKTFKLSIYQPVIRLLASVCKKFPGVKDFKAYCVCTVSGTILNNHEVLASYGLGSLLETWELLIRKAPMDEKTLLKRTTKRLQKKNRKLEKRLEEALKVQTHLQDVVKETTDTLKQSLTEKDAKIGDLEKRVIDGERRLQEEWEELNEKVQKDVRQISEGLQEDVSRKVSNVSQSLEEMKAFVKDENERKEETLKELKALMEQSREQALKTSQKNRKLQSELEDMTRANEERKLAKEKEREEERKNAIVMMEKAAGEAAAAEEKSIEAMITRMEARMEEEIKQARARAESVAEKTKEELQDLMEDAVSESQRTSDRYKEELNKLVQESAQKAEKELQALTKKLLELGDKLEKDKKDLILQNEERYKELKKATKRALEKEIGRLREDITKEMSELKQTVNTHHNKKIEELESSLKTLATEWEAMKEAQKRKKAKKAAKKAELAARIPQAPTLPLHLLQRGNQQSSSSSSSAGANELANLPLAEQIRRKELKKRTEEEEQRRVAAELSRGTSLTVKTNASTLLEGLQKRFHSMHSIEDLEMVEDFEEEEEEEEEESSDDEW